MENKCVIIFESGDSPTQHAEENEQGGKTSSLAKKKHRVQKSNRFKKTHTLKVPLSYINSIRGEADVTPSWFFRRTARRAHAGEEEEGPPWACAYRNKTRREEWKKPESLAVDKRRTFCV